MHLLPMAMTVASQLTTTMLMELASPMGKHEENTFGHLLQLMVILDIVLVPAPAQGWILHILELCHRSLDRITFAILETDTIQHSHSGTMQTPFGMALAVVPPVAAVASTTHPGSVNNYHNQPLITLR